MIFFLQKNKKLKSLTYLFYFIVANNKLKYDENNFQKIKKKNNNEEKKKEEEEEEEKEELDTGKETESFYSYPEPLHTNKSNIYNEGISTMSYNNNTGISSIPSDNNDICPTLSSHIRNFHISGTDSKESKLSISRSSSKLLISSSSTTTAVTSQTSTLPHYHNKHRNQRPSFSASPIPSIFTAPTTTNSIIAASLNSDFL